VDEVRGLVADGFGEARAMGSVGYKQVKAHVEGQLDAAELDDAIVRATRVFVRRQRTWLREQSVQWVPA
jgi:tRNA dimethylallyltransferase